MEFIAGAVIGGLVCAMTFYAYQKGKSEKETSESYTRGYKDGREIEKRAILDYIDLLKNDANISFYDNEFSKGRDS